jgi:hypothetical protein
MTTDSTPMRTSGAVDDLPFAPAEGVAAIANAATGRPASAHGPDELQRDRRGGGDWSAARPAAPAAETGGAGGAVAAASA